MLEKNQKDFFYKIFDIPATYNINKDKLKKAYHSISMKIHPDLRQEIYDRNNQIRFGSDEGTLKKCINKIYSLFAPKAKSIASSDLNRAYDILKDDYSRARLFTTPSDSVETEFLDECMELEDKILRGDNITDLLQKRIDECRINYRDPIFLAKWSYYIRLLKLAKSAAS